MKTISFIPFAARDRARLGFFGRLSVAPAHGNAR
jgi:hypothetical protein